MIDWTQILVPIISAFAGAASGWIFGRRQAKAQAVSVEIENLLKIIEQWKELYLEAKNDLKEKDKENNE